eukprot:TRINITY_DN23239_c0_g1_i1.p1 TRINITY_DN23239_c0_g1~~TRINITY_DN23239_c0_g1_i1.p1  ORF type:complete len:329 (+),score=59.94 TRINITY_DN23239_c0_g1_i1:75-1061(+)
MQAGDSSRLGTLRPERGKRVSAEQLQGSPPPERIALLGIPSDHNSSFLRGPADAPPVVRAALMCDSSNAYSEGVVDVCSELSAGDCGDLVLANTGTPQSREADRQAIYSAAAAVTRGGAKLLSIGGDHSVTFPIVDALSERYAGRVEILHFDAHPDMYDSLLDNRLSHASPFARILEQGRVRRVVQLGIRTENAHQRGQRLSRFSGLVHSVPMRSWPPPPALLTFPPDAKVYVSIDADALDPAFAPGVSHHEPGGLSTRELLRTLASVVAPGGLIGGDVVEYNPARDHDGVTAMVMAKVLKELAELAMRSGNASAPAAAPPRPLRSAL